MIGVPDFQNKKEEIKYWLAVGKSMTDAGWDICKIIGEPLDPREPYVQDNKKD